MYNEPMSIELDVLRQVKDGFNLSDEQAEVSLLLLQLRAGNLGLSFDEYIKTYHPEGVVKKDGLLHDEYKGYVRFLNDDAQALIYAGKTADFSTFIHENAHVFRRQLAGELKQKAETAFKVQGGVWNERQEEAFALGFEEYVRLRLCEDNDENKKDIFEKGSRFMQRIYNGLDRIIDLNPEIIKVYDQMFTEGRFIFDKVLFDKTVDNIYALKDETTRFASSHVYLGMTPPVYQELGFERLPVMITARHLKTIMSEAGVLHGINYHGLTPDMIKQIPEAIKKPLIVMQSQNKNNVEDVIAVIELKDKSGNPIIIPFSPNKKGNFNSIEIDVNLAKSIYGKESFDSFLNKAVKENRILYLSEKSREIVPPELQLLRNYKSRLLYDNIAQYHKDVKRKNPDFGKLYQKTAYYSGAQLKIEFLNNLVYHGNKAKLRYKALNNNTFLLSSKISKEEYEKRYKKAIRGFFEYGKSTSTIKEQGTGRTRKASTGMER